MAPRPSMPINPRQAPRSELVAEARYRLVLDVAFRSAEFDPTAVLPAAQRIYMDASYRFRIKEEYFLADTTTRGTPQKHRDLPQAARAGAETVERELLAAQLEVATAPSSSPANARAQLLALRDGLVEMGREHGLLVLDSGTQALTHWNSLRQTKKNVTTI